MSEHHGEISEAMKDGGKVMIGCNLAFSCMTVRFWSIWVLLQNIGLQTEMLQNSVLSYMIIDVILQC